MTWMQVLAPERTREMHADDPWAHVGNEPGSLASRDALGGQVRLFFGLRLETACVQHA